MIEFLLRIFDTSDFPARWQCGNWSPGLGWLHITADLLTFAAYTAIPCVLAFFVLRRKDVAFPRVLWLFCAFIMACGIVHLIEATIFWHPWYRLSGVAKAVTAGVSCATVVSLCWVIPAAIDLPSMSELAKEIEQRKAGESNLRLQTESLSKANEDLTQANQFLDDFARVASHDLRTPLRAIASLADWISEDSAHELSEESQENLQLIRARVVRMRPLLNDLLAYHRASEYQGLAQSIQCGEFLSRVVDDCAPPESFNIKISTDVDSFYALVTPLETCLRNLVGNAIKHHNRTQGTVWIGCEKEADHVRFTIRDDGPGIPAEFHGEIFKMFQKLESRDEVEGSGIGLALVKRITSIHGAEIELDSNPSGSTFYLRWPIGTEELP